MEWSIQELARVTGTTSRTLRHYGDRGLLQPVRTGSGGMRYYDAEILPRLLRILLLRAQGVGIKAIKDVFARDIDDVSALREHVALLEQQQRDMTRRITSIRRAITNLEEGETLVPRNVFETFDHTQYREEVEQRWGGDAYAKSDQWWRALSAAQKQVFQQEHLDIAADYGRLAAQGTAVDSAATEEVVRRHVEWLQASGTFVTVDHVVGLGDMYVADPRFAKNYPGYAEYVRDAMRSYAERNL